MTSEEFLDLRVGDMVIYKGQERKVTGISCEISGRQITKSYVRLRGIKKRVPSEFVEPREVLCQDCLRVRKYTDERHLGDEKCVCGGDFCGCPSCLDIIKRLKEGKREAGQIGTVDEWSPETGIKSREV